ncbi:type V CRISPR-associated protein Cas4 [Segatella copri]|uniref:type V CRISPR-associated protein Cas4 n=1 Tax=Segatella copri TaxID=165179 RepID=UPI0022300061|nr:type V CRISPR-associated protein Cas4 [Segatella copri]MCW4073235.1 type V CRISPR-associated protein Cas4 [Segatella copri]
MDDYIQLSTLNDFIFCPYSIYLHSVYMESDGDLYKAAPQTKGTLAHQGVDEKKGSTRKSDIMALPVYCDELGISGKIDVYKQDKRLLIERKNNLKRIFRGQIYQLWGQYFCLKEMGYEVEQLAFYEISTNKMIPVDLPGELGKQELMGFIEQFKRYNPASTTILVNPNKCIHCIYCNLCDKTNTDNVYT